MRGRLDTSRWAHRIIRPKSALFRVWGRKANGHRIGKLGADRPGTLPLVLVLVPIHRFPKS